jgi:hypothetical protein
VDAGTGAAAAARGRRLAVWTEELRRELDSATAPRVFCFRDDDAGWADERLLALTDLFARYSLPLDVAVIPAALEVPLASRLLARAEADPRLSFHQHGRAHTNHEPSGRACEFGPARSARRQRADIAAGATRLAELLGETEPLFTPPWNRCTATTGRCLLELGFRALVRDASADPLGIEGLDELQVHVDWARADAVRQLSAALLRPGPIGVMLHHELIGRGERERLEDLLRLLAPHPNADCVPLRSLVDADPKAVASFG